MSIAIYFLLAQIFGTIDALDENPKKVDNFFRRVQTNSLSVAILEVKGYLYYEGFACMKDIFDKGNEGIDYDIYPYNFESCEMHCSSFSSCEGFESSSGKCKIYKTNPKYFEFNENTNCYVKNRENRINGYVYYSGYTCSTENPEENFDIYSYDIVDCERYCTNSKDCLSFEFDSTSEKCKIYQTVQSASKSKKKISCFTKTKIEKEIIGYTDYARYACRTDEFVRGIDDTTYDNYNYGLEECAKLCFESNYCKGFESSDGRCEHWKEIPSNFIWQPTHSCYVKSPYSAAICNMGTIEGRRITEYILQNDFENDCNQVLAFEQKTVELFQTNEENEKVFNLCARNEVNKVVSEKMAQCLTPIKCGEAGNEAAAQIVAVYTSSFCSIQNTFTSAIVSIDEEKNELKEKCRDYAISSCKSFLPAQYIYLLSISTCTGDIDSELDWDTLEELEGSCETTVDIITTFGL